MRAAYTRYARSPIFNNPMSLARRFLTGAALNLFDQALRFLAIFVMTPIILASIGDTDYGFWVLLMSIFGHYALLDFGLSASTSRFFARAIGKKDVPELEKLINTTLAIFLRIGMIAVLLSVVAWFVIPAFNNDPARIRLIHWIVVIYGAYLSVGFPVRVFRSYLKSEMRYDIIVLASTIQIVLGSTALYYFLKQGHGLLTLALVNAIAGFIEYAIVTYGAIRLLKKIRIDRSLVCLERRKELIRYSTTAFVNQLANTLRNGIDPLIIGTVVGLSSVTYYSIGMRFPIFFNDIMCAVLGGQLLALFGQVHGRRDDGSLEKGYLTATRLSTVVAVFGGASMIFYGSDFILRWVGPGYSLSYQIMVILTIPYVLLLINYPAFSLLFTLDKHKYLAKATIIGGIFNVLMSIILAHIIGIHGVVWATLIEMLVVYGIVMPLVVSRVTQMPKSQIIVSSMLKPLLISVLILAPFFVMVRSLVQPDYIRLILLGLAQTVWFGAVAWFAILKPDERRQILVAARLRKPMT
jgi:O-antigen/teichoic acid export membrane protein